MNSAPPGAAGGPILVTGASGFVGRHVTAALLQAGYPPEQVVALTRSADRQFSSGIRSVQGDITSRPSLEAVIREIRPAAVVHLAAIAEPARASASPDAAWKINFESVRFLAESLLTFCPEARLVFAGSAEAYGTSFINHPGPILEAAALQPVSIYGATKAAADILLGQMAWQGLRAIRFRAFNHTGPGQSAAYVVASFATQIAAIEAGLQPPRLEVGNLKSSRDFLDVRDVARAYVQALSCELDFCAAPVFNVCSGNAIRIADVLQRLMALSSASIDVSVDASRLRPSEVEFASGSNSAAWQQLGWKQEIDFDTTLFDTLSYCRQSIRTQA